ncbi:hypothetical protein Q5425_45025 [Amycolatopsis sp. A133]|uniref:hypothetical protein n=1 Tax=Amycolatopsis sp. A133 TaxID=3064472 RepID=UPI0027E807FC|nr:hypothetical protein [Amycolatopsis sp. A133]MDQ7810932.1 hypothetical protein [Amycolatopsis sp. A133]
MGVRLQWAFGRRPAGEERGMSAREPRLPGPGDRGREAAHSGEPGLGSAVALAGFLAATRIAETATGVVLSAAGVLSGAKTPAKHAAAPGGE